MTNETRPLRADAERNRQAIICAAGSVLAEEGSNVTLEHIAAVAGVGVGTIYRRFGSIEDLVSVVLEEKMRLYADRSEEAADLAKEQPWEAFREYVLYILEQQATDLAFSEVVASPHGVSKLFQEESNRALRASIRLVERARKANAIRADFHHSDLFLLTNANRGVLEGTQRIAPLGWKRFAEYMLDAFRHPGDEELTPPAEIWKRAVSRTNVDPETQ